MTQRGPTKPAKRRRAIKRQRKSAIERNEALAQSGYESNHPSLRRTRSIIRADRRASVAISNRWLESRGSDLIPTRGPQQ